MIALLVVLTLIITLVSYLELVRAQNVSVERSQAWNRALAVAEAGVEEALAQMNHKLGTNSPLGANGWGGPNGGVYGPVSRTLSDGSFTAAIVTGLLPNPVVFATGYTTVPALSAELTRTVRVTTAPRPAFGVGMAALFNVDCKGNNIYVDSYDSSDDLYSTAGMYDWNKRKAGGDVASNFGGVNVGNADIKGKVLSGPDGFYTLLPNGSAGDLNWNGPGIHPGWYRNDFNMDFPDVEAPYTSGIPPTGKGTNKFELGSFGYMLSGDLNLKTGDNMLVLGNAILYITGNVNLSGQAVINIAPGASLKLYVAGPKSVFTQVNTTGNAATFQYYGLPTNTEVTWTGNDQYVGTVYAPQAVFKLGGGGQNILDYQGSCVVKSVTMDGRFNFHYDENLRRRGPMLGYTVSSWREL